MTIEDVCTTLNSLHSVLDIPESRDCPIRLFHNYFREFLLDEERHKEVNLRIDKMQTHISLGDSCLRLMSELSRDICSLSMPCTLVKEVYGSKIATCFLSNVQYACRH